MKSKAKTETSRSATMRAVKSKRNKSTEQRVRMLLTRNGIAGWTLNNNKILGKPDFWFDSQKKAVFVDGCFWHGCMCRTHIPYTNSPYWKVKVSNNIKRDKKVNRQLKSGGIEVLRLWEHEIKDERLILTKLQKFLSVK